MRILFLLLLLLNLGYFGWHWQQQETAPVQVKGPIPAEPGTKTLVLLNEAGPAADTANAAPHSDGARGTAPANR